MSLKEKLFVDLKEAMKHKNTISKDAIQMVRAGVLQIEKDAKIELNDDGIIDIIIKEIKKCNDVLPDFQKGGRQDLVDEITEKIKILKTYLPEQLSNSQVEEIILCAIKEANATSIKDMGIVMKLVSSKTKGVADSKIVSNIVKSNLQNL